MGLSHLGVLLLIQTTELATVPKFQNVTCQKDKVIVEHLQYGIDSILGKYLITAEDLLVALVKLIKKQTYQA